MISISASRDIELILCNLFPDPSTATHEFPQTNSLKLEFEPGEGIKITVGVPALRLKSARWWGNDVFAVFEGDLETCCEVVRDVAWADTKLTPVPNEL